MALSSPSRTNVAHHLTRHLTVYLNGKYLPHEEAKISVDDRGFLFGDGVYEVIKALKVPSPSSSTTTATPHLFTEAEHMTRMQRGLERIRIAEGGEEEKGATSTRESILHEIATASRELLRINHLGISSDAYIYSQVTRGSAPRAHAFPKSPTPPPTVYVIAKPFMHPPETTFTVGVGAVTSPDTRWACCDIKSINLLPNILANQKAKENGCYECLFIRNGNLVEASHSNVFAVLDGELLTHPLDNILPGITRDVILRRAHEAGLKVKECAIPWARFQDMSEIFVTATTNEITPIVTVDGKQVGDGKVGPISTTLRHAFSQRWHEMDRHAEPWMQKKR